VILFAPRLGTAWTVSLRRWPLLFLRFTDSWICLGLGLHDQFLGENGFRLTMHFVLCAGGFLFSFLNGLRILKIRERPTNQADSGYRGGLTANCRTSAVSGWAAFLRLGPAVLVKERIRLYQTCCICSSLKAC